MDIDELKTAWRALDERVSHSLALNLQTRRDFTMDRARASLNHLAWSPRLNLAMDVLWAVINGSFLARHIAEPRFALPAGLLLVTAIVFIVSNARQLALLSGIDYSGPVVAIQRTLADVYAMRVRETRWLLLSAPLLWMPMLIVLARFLGVDLYAIASGAWILANFGFGALVIVVGYWLSKRFGPRLKTSTAAKKMADGFAGASLARAITLVNEISEFERE